MEKSDYQQQYKEQFRSDLSLSKEYSKDANSKLLQDLGKILNYETDFNQQPHPLDLQGYDRKISLDFSFGIRVRLIQKASFADFTVDFKEWSHEISDTHYYYYYAYVEHPQIKHKVYFYMIFDYRKLKQLAKEQKIKPIIGQNNKHGLVKFQGFKIKDLFQNNLIINYEGQPDILTVLELPANKSNRIDRLEVIV